MPGNSQVNNWKACSKEKLNEMMLSHTTVKRSLTKGNTL